MPYTPPKSGRAKLGLISAAEGKISDRRGAIRYPFVASVQVIEAESEARLIGRVSDLAWGGCYVDAINPFPNGTRVRFRILKGNENFEGLGKVVFPKVGIGNGIAFEAVTPDQDQLLQDWLAKLS